MSVKEVSPLQKNKRNKNFYLQSRIILTIDQCQLCPGVHPQQPGQQVKGRGDSPLLLSSGETPLVDQMLGNVQQGTGRRGLAKGQKRRVRKE